MIDSLQAGRELSFSLGRFPDVFSKFYVSVIRVGESSGTLETAFLRMYEYLSMEKRIRDKVKAALRYPITVMVAIGIAIGIITMFVLPKFAPIFAALGDNLPWPTRVLMGTSTFASEYWYLVRRADRRRRRRVQARAARSRGPLSLGQAQAARADRRRHRAPREPRADLPLVRADARIGRADHPRAST